MLEARIAPAGILITIALSALGLATGCGSQASAGSATQEQVGEMLDVWTAKWVALNSLLGEVRQADQLGTKTASDDRRVYRSLAPLKRAGSQARTLLRHNNDDWKTSVVDAGDALTFWAVDFYKLKKPHSQAELRRQSRELASEAADAAAKLEDAYAALDRELPAAARTER